uniref:Uncharacterized protein n=1 Tax=Meloidogyne enterolobii TaxID=390850 RepID=A0A6V7WF83_MELEN|nr:unnamed protein product [Meloidogyne enterolobii]
MLFCACFFFARLNVHRPSPKSPCNINDRAAAGGERIKRRKRGKVDMIGDWYGII